MSILQARFVTTIIVLFAGASVGYGQVTAGSIRGVMTDPSGAVIPGVQVTATNLATEQQVSAQATGAGVFFLGNLQVGSYRVEATSEGFKTFVQQPVLVSTASSTTLDIELEVGQTVEVITVEGSYAPLLQTDNAEISTIVERKMVLDLPIELSGAGSDGSGRRQIEMFIYLTPGVTGSQWAKHFLGTQQHTSQAVVDGIPVALQESPGLTSRIGPPFEAIEEFKVSTTMYPADQGRGFGIVNYTAKSGTNQFHGNLYEYLRNDKLDASGFFSPTRPIVRQNEFGGSLGGPIIKNRTFFHFSYQGFRKRGGVVQSGLRTIPALPFRTGDFSSLRRTDGSLIPIYDPATTRPDGQGSFERDLFPGNVIPSSRITDVAKQAFGLMPSPDTAGITNNFVNKTSRPGDDDVWMVKLNHNQGPHNFTFTMWESELNEIRGGVWGDVPVDTGFTRVFNGTSIRVSWDSAISPNMLNHFGYGFSKSDKDRLVWQNPGGGNPYNIPGLSPTAEQYPAFRFGGYEDFGNTSAGPDITRDHSNIFTENVSWTTGSHSIKFGGEVWFSFFSRGDFRIEGGEFNFSNLSTTQPNAANQGSLGDSVASFLLGDAVGARHKVNPLTAPYTTRYAALFVDDKFQLTPRLTLSLGFRYEVPTPIYETNDRFSHIDLGLANPGAGGRPGAYVFGNDLARPETSRKEFSPRLGIAYRVNDKTVIRSGFGILYAQSNAQVNGQELGGQSLLGGYVGVQVLTSLDQGITPATNVKDGIPPIQPPLPNLSSDIFVGNVADWMNPFSGRSAYTVNYNFVIQRELPWGMVSEAAYVANKGTRLAAALDNLNQVPAEFLSMGSLLNQPYDSPDAFAAGIRSPFPGFGGTVSQTLRRFPQYTDVRVHASTSGSSSYQSLQAKLDKRFSQGLGLMINYTLSKNISNTGSQSWAGFDGRPIDQANRGLEKSLTSFDETHRFIANWIYELPLGKNTTGARSKLLRGWQIGMTAMYRSQSPIRITGGVPLPIFGGGNRPDRVSGANRLSADRGGFDPAKDLLLNAAAWTNSAPFTIGDGARYEPDFRGFGSFNENFNLTKKTYITETMNIEFRVETFNLFNRTIFNNPSSNANSSQSFGRVGGQANLPREIQMGLRFNF